MMFEYTASDEATLDFYNQAIVDLQRRLDLDLSRGDIVQAAVHVRCLRFCSYITAFIQIQRLRQWRRHPNQGVRFMGCLWLQDYRELMKYESYN